MTRLPLFFLYVLLILASHQSATAAPAEIEAMITEALTYNPEVTVAAAQWRMAEEKAKQAGTLDDPMVMIGIQNAMISDPLSFSSDTTTAKILGVSQMYPLFGKRALQRTIADYETSAARWTVEERKVGLRQMVLENWARLGYVESSLRLVDKNIALLDDIGRLAEASYKSGMGRQPDILRVQIERSRMEEMKLGLRQQKKSLLAMFAGLLHRNDEQELNIADGVIEPVKLSAAELEELAQQTRPELQARLARIDKAAAAVRLAEREFYPDIIVNLEYMQRDRFTSGMTSSDGADMYSASVSFNLPLQQGRRRAMVAEAQQEKIMAFSEVDGLRHAIRHTISDLLAKLEATAGMARLYRDGLLPQNEFARESTLAAYRGGQIEFMSVLDSQMKLLSDEQKYAGFVAEHQMLRAQLEATVGTRIE